MIQHRKWIGSEFHGFTLTARKEDVGSSAALDDGGLTHKHNAIHYKQYIGISLFAICFNTIRCYSILPTGPLNICDLIKESINYKGKSEMGGSGKRKK